MRRVLPYIGLALAGLNIWRYLVDGHWYNLFAGAFVLATSILYLVVVVPKSNKRVGF